MNLLILSNNPNRASFRQRIGIYLPVLDHSGIRCHVERFPENLLTRWRLFRKCGDYDGVLLHKKALNFWDARIVRTFTRKLIYDLDDAVMYSPSRPDSDRTSHKRLFRRTAKLADRIIAGNEYLARHARQYCADVQILPTGLDTKDFDTSAARSDKKVRLVWIGSKSTLKYLAEIHHVLVQIAAQYPDIVLRIIADQFPDIEGLPMESCYWSLEQEKKDLVNSDIGLAPLPDNRFTRGKCGFKILQYFAASLPCIASPVGMNRDLVIHETNGFLAETESQWGSALCRLIEDAQLRKKMGQAGRRMAETYDQERIGAHFCALVSDVLKS